MSKYPLGSNLGGTGDWGGDWWFKVFHMLNIGSYLAGTGHWGGDWGFRVGIGFRVLGLRSFSFIILDPTRNAGLRYATKSNEDLTPTRHHYNIRPRRVNELKRTALVLQNAVICWRKTCLTVWRSFSTASRRSVATAALVRKRDKYAAPVTKSKRRRSPTAVPANTKRCPASTNAAPTTKKVCRKKHVSNHSRVPNAAPATHPRFLTFIFDRLSTFIFDRFSTFIFDPPPHDSYSLISYQLAAQWPSSLIACALGRPSRKLSKQGTDMQAMQLYPGWSGCWVVLCSVPPQLQ